METQKHLLFYSNLCQYSQDTLRTISKKNIRNLFMTICIDNPKFQSSIPAFVDRVPFILTNNQEIVIDDNIQLFLEIISKQTTKDELTPYSTLEMGSKLSDGFSYITDGENAPDTFGWSHNFVRLDAEIPMINPPIDTSQEKGNKRSNVHFESLLQERDRDLDMIFQKQQRV